MLSLIPTEQATQIVTRHTRIGFLVGLVPLPLVDVLILTGVQLKMVHSLAKLYGVEFSEHLGKSVIASLVGGGVPVSISLNVGSLLKAVPLYGLIAGIVTTSVTGGASTYAVGKVFMQHFESGGTLLTLDPAQVRAYYVEQYKRGEQLVRQNFTGVKP